MLEIDTETGPLWLQIILKTEDNKLKTKKNEEDNREVYLSQEVMSIHT